MMGGYHSHPATPQSTVPSPGAASINSIHEEYSDMNSPSWPRTPASPVRIHRMHACFTRGAHSDVPELIEFR